MRKQRQRGGDSEEKKDICQKAGSPEEKNTSTWPGGAAFSQYCEKAEQEEDIGVVDMIRAVASQNSDVLEVVEQTIRTLYSEDRAALSPPIKAIT